MGKLEISDHVTYCFGGATYYGVVVGRHDFAENLHLPTAYKVEFDEPQRAITKGQSVVLYDGDVVVGGGTIV